jgi:hypothetical protein
VTPSSPKAQITIIRTVVTGKRTRGSSGPATIFRKYDYGNELLNFGSVPT